MSETEYLRQLVAYNRSVFDRFVRSLERRPWAQSTSDSGIGHGSLKDTLVHILNVHEAWMVAVAQGRWDVFDRPDRRATAVRSWRDLRAYRDRVWAGVDELLATVTDRKLRQRVKAPWMPGRYTLRDAFFQASIEQAHHLGEIIGVLWQHHREPPSMTWIENLPRRRTAPVAHRARKRGR